MRLILIIALFILTSFNVSEDLKQDVKMIVKKIEIYNKLDHEQVGIVGMTTAQYHNFIKLKNTATINELLSLLQHKNAVVKGYASWALADRKYTEVDKILSSFLDTGEKVTTRNGCEESMGDLASEFYYRVFYQNFDKKVSINDSLILLRGIEKMDSVLLYREKYSDLLENALENNNSNQRTYERIKELSVKGGLPSAIVALAKYKQKDDIPTIIKLGEKSFSAISAFPDESFWGFLLGYKDKNRSIEYFQAISSYKSKSALEILNEIYLSCDSVQINHLDEALIKNYCPVFQDLILRIWETHKTIDLTVTKKLISDCPEKSAKSFVNGFTNDKQFNFLQLDYNYGTADSILPLIIENAASYHKEKIPEICNKYILTSGFMNLSAFLEYIKKNKLGETTPNLLRRLSGKNYPFDIFDISETLLSFKYLNINEQLKAILSGNRADWDRGNWSAAFNELLKKNNVVLN